MPKTTEQVNADELRRRLKTLIIQGKLRPGETLMPERKMTTEFGLSLARVRAALASLALEGLIVRMRGRGSFVADPLPKHVAMQTVEVINCHTYGDSVYQLAMDILHSITESCESLSLRAQLRQIASHAGDMRSEHHAELVDELKDAIGVVFLPMPESFPSRWRIVPEVLWNIGIPCVKVGWPDAQLLAMHQVPCVNFDRRLMARMAAEHAIFAGYKRLAYISPEVHRHNEESRLAGFLDAVTANRLLLYPDYVVRVSEDDFENVGKVVKQLVKCDPRPEVFCCSSEAISGQAAKALMEIGLQIPGDIALVCCIGGGNSGLFSPISLTKSVPPAAECGQRAAELIRDLVDGKAAPESTVVVEAKLEVGESCPSVRVPSRTG